ncbi:hypothetical protein [Streptomyces sp. cg35]|uniref:hypothetical protein n=1 Tax=Streptomyces sp. cg35 TaxID=3421650 RepID=UPI003D181D8C
MKLTFDDNWTATVTGEPLPITPRFDFAGQRVRVATYGSAEEQERFQLDTFGSQDWLWDAPDEARFDPTDRQLVGLQFQLPYEIAGAEDCARVPDLPLARPGGLRADEARDFRLEAATELCRAPGDRVLTCLRDLDVLDEPLEARIGVAQDVALLVQHGTVVGWSLTDPVRYLTSGFAAPDSAPAAQSTRLLFTESLDLTTSPLLDDVRHRDPSAVERLRALHQALRAQREDRRRADALLALIGDLAEDYGSG